MEVSTQQHSLKRGSAVSFPPIHPTGMHKNGIIETIGALNGGSAEISEDITVADGTPAESLAVPSSAAKLAGASCSSVTCLAFARARR